MPISKDPHHGGLEKDGTRSSRYCSFCYNDGEFVQKDITLEQMQGVVLEQLLKSKMPRLLVRIYVRNIKKLSRWKTK